MSGIYRGANTALDTPRSLESPQAFLHLNAFTFHIELSFDGRGPLYVFGPTCVLACVSFLNAVYLQCPIVMNSRPQLLNLNGVRGFILAPETGRK